MSAMFRLLGRGSRRAATPPVLVPAGAIRPGEDDRALVAALSDYLALMREAGHAWSELEPRAVEAGAADAYLNTVEQSGHGAWLAAADPATLLRAEVALELAAPELARLHAEAADLAHRRRPKPKALQKLDERFFELGGREAADAALAGQIAALPGLEVVADADYAGAVAAAVSAGEPPQERHRDLLLERLEHQLTDPFQAAVAIVLGHAGQHAPVFLAPGPRTRRDDGRTVTAWLVEAGAARYRALPLADGVAVSAPAPGGGWQPLDHIGRDEIAVAADWAREGYVAQATVMALDELNLTDRLATLAFHSIRELPRTGAEAAAFHLALKGARPLAVVVFPNVTAVVDPATNGRLAEFHRSTLAAEAAAHRDRLADLS